MARKNATVYMCQECGYTSPKWMGQCPACQEWNTLVEERVHTKSEKNERSDFSDKKWSVFIKDVKNEVLSIKF